MHHHDLCPAVVLPFLPILVLAGLARLLYFVSRSSVEASRLAFSSLYRTTSSSKPTLYEQHNDRYAHTWVSWVVAPRSQPTYAIDAKRGAHPARSALIIGATGGVGQVLLQDILKSNNFNRVGEFGRRVTEAAKLPAEAQGKLEQKTIDFEHLDAATLREGNWDTVFITSVSSSDLILRDVLTRCCRLGTSRAVAGTPENFEKIDRE